MGAGVISDKVQRGGDSCPVRGGRGLGVLLRGSREEIRGCFARFDLLSRFRTGFSVGDRVRSIAGA